MAIRPERSMIDPELGPVVDLPGTVAFDGTRARRGYRLSRLLVAMRDADQRVRFREDPEALMNAYGLNNEERGLIERRDYDGMLEYGISIYALGKASFSLGTDLIGIGTQSRGEDRAAFLMRRLGRTEA
jgi:protocatechuate 4,5-dioxygenase alpha subunit